MSLKYPAVIIALLLLAGVSYAQEAPGDNYPEAAAAGSWILRPGAGFSVYLSSGALVYVQNTNKEGYNPQFPPLGNRFCINVVPPPAGYVKGTIKINRC